MVIVETGIDPHMSRLADILGGQTTPWLESDTKLDVQGKLFLGSIQGARIARQMGAIVYGLRDKYRCTAYYEYFPSLINGNAVACRFGDLRAKQEQFFKRKGRVFVRPDSNEKLFTGQTVYQNEWEARIARSFDAYDPLSDDEIVMVSDALPIGRELRCYIHRGRVITIGELDGYGDLSDMIPVAQSLVPGDFEPDPIWVMDIAEVGGRWKVLEIGSLSCASPYTCDLDVIAESIRHELSSL